MNLPGGGEEAGELVETGSFRVDPRRMLEVLSKHQLRPPERFLEAWMRCAVSAGASAAELRTVSGPEGKGVEFSFDGRPFGREELLDVFSVLIEGRAGPARYLAAGLLALGRTQPALLTAASGGELFKLDGLRLRPAGAAGQGRTALRCLWRRLPVGMHILLKAVNFPSSGLLNCSPVKLRGPRASSPSFPERRAADGRYAFEAGGRYGFVSPLPGEQSEIAVSVYGVLAEVYQEKLPVPVRVEVNDDSLSLDASMSACVQDERYEALEKFLAERAEETALEETRRQQEEFPAAGRLLENPRLRELWRARMGLDPDWAAVTAPPGPLRALRCWWRWLVTGGEIRPWRLGPGASRFGELGQRTFWLRDLALKGAGGRLGQALESVPLMFSARGAPLSIKNIKWLARSGILDVSSAFSGESGASDDRVWVATMREALFLRSVVPVEKWTGWRWKFTRGL